MSGHRGRRDYEQWRKGRMGRLGLDGDTLMGPDWFKQQADLAVEETDLWPEETAKNAGQVAARDRLLRIAGLACIVSAVLIGAAGVIGAIIARGK